MSFYKVLAWKIKKRLFKVNYYTFIIKSKIFINFVVNFIDKRDLRNIYFNFKYLKLRSSLNKRFINNS